MHVGILQCGHVPPAVADAHGDFAAMFRRLLGEDGFTYETWDVEGMDFPPSPHAAEGWLVTGSRHGAYDPLPFIAPLEDLIRAIRDEGLPMVGVCFGHQVIAQALGGRVEKWRGGWTLGRTTYHLEGLGEVALNAWHQDQVTTLPPGARVVGETEGCRVAALAYGDRIWTIQPHPEFSSSLVRDYIALRRGSGDYPDALMDVAQEALAEPLDRTAVGAHMAGVLRRA